MRISDWSSDVCSSDLPLHGHALGRTAGAQSPAGRSAGTGDRGAEMKPQYQPLFPDDLSDEAAVALSAFLYDLAVARSEEHTSELQSLMRISYAVFCLTKKNKNKICTIQDTYYIDPHNKSNMTQHLN